MNTTILNRTILAAVIASVLGFGLGAPSSARAQDQATKDPQASEEDESDPARGRRNRDLRAAREAREAEAAAAAAAVQANAEANRANAEAIHAAAEENRGRAQAEARHLENEQRQAEQAQRVAEQQRGEDRDARQEQYRQQQSQLAAQAEREAAQAREQRERSVEQAREQRERGLEQAREQEARQASEQQERSRDRQERYTPAPPVHQDDDRYQDGSRGDDWGNDSDRRRRIEEQRSQAERYQRAQQAAQDRARRNAITLQNQHRTSQYRYQQDYYSRLRQYNQRNDWQRYDYNNDPYFHTAPSYRYQRDGRYYSVNRYAAEMLQQAVNYGYAEGIRAGRADRYDSWRYSYRDSFAYMDANYGYRGLYVSQFDYNYYFRQGFQRGYEDGYYSRRRYGRQHNGSNALFGTVLSLVLNLQPYRY